MRPAVRSSLPSARVAASTAKNSPAAGAGSPCTLVLVNRESALFSSPAAPSRSGSTPERSRSSTMRLVSIRDWASSTLLSSSRPAIWVCRMKPSTTTTVLDRASVLITTRSCSERRHTALKASVSSAPSWRSWATLRRARRASGTVVTWSRGAGLVPHPAHGQHHLGVLRVALDLGPQPLDVHVDQPGVGGVPVAPDLLQQHLAGEDLAGFAGQRDQQVELQRGERDLLAVADHLVRGHVDGDLADGQLLGRLVLGAPDPGPDPGHQLLRLERLDHVVVRAGLQAQHDVDGVALRGQHDDRHAGLGADGPAHVDAVHPGEHQVEQHDVGAQLPDGRQRAGAVGHHGGVEALPAQHDGQHLGQRRIVVHHKYPRLHGGQHPTRWSAAASGPSGVCGYRSRSAVRAPTSGPATPSSTVHGESQDMAANWAYTAAVRFCRPSLVSKASRAPRRSARPAATCSGASSSNWWSGRGTPNRSTSVDRTQSTNSPDASWCRRAAPYAALEAM